MNLGKLRYNLSSLGLGNSGGNIPAICCPFIGISIIATRFGAGGCGTLTKFDRYFLETPILIRIDVAADQFLEGFLVGFCPLLGNGDVLHVVIGTTGHESSYNEGQCSLNQILLHCKINY